MGFKLRRSARKKHRAPKSSSRGSSSKQSKQKPEHSSTSTTTPSSKVSPPASLDFPPQDLTHIHQDDDVSSIHFGESVSSPEYCYVAPVRRSMKETVANHNTKAPPSLKFVRSDSNAHEERLVVPRHATPTSAQALSASAPLTSMIYLSLVTFQQKHQDNAREVVKQSVERHMYKHVGESRAAQPPRRCSAPVDVDECSSTLEEEEEDDTTPRRQRTLSAPVDVDECFNLLEEEEEHVTRPSPRLRRLPSTPVDVDDCSNVTDDDNDSIDDLDEIVYGHLDRRDLAAAIDVYRSMIDSGTHQCEVFQVYLELSVLYLLHGDKLKAVWSSERALEKSRLGGGHDQVRSLASLGVMLLYAQKPSDALDNFRLALQLQCKVFGCSTVAIPLLLNNMAICHFCMHQSCAGEALLQESIELQRHAHQTDLASLQDMASTLINLSFVASELKDFDRAASYMEEGLMVIESVLGVDDAYVKVCSEALNRNVILRDQHEHSAESMPHPPRSLSLFGNADGVPMRHRSCHPIEFILLGSLQHELTCEKRVNNAVASEFRNALVAVVVADEGKQSPRKSILVDVDGSCVMNAELHLQGIHAQVLKSVQSNRVDEALDLLRSTLRSHKTKYRVAHHLVGTAFHNIALVHLHARQYKDAQWNFQEAINVRVAVLGTDHPDVSASMLKLGLIQMATGDLDAAYLTLTQVLHTRRKAIGYHQPEVARILNLIGCIHFELSNLDAALKSMKEAIDIQRHFPGRKEDVADTLANLGFLYAKRSDFTEAKAALTEALAMQRRVLSDTHPRTIVTRQNLNYALSLHSGSVVFQTLTSTFDATSTFEANCHSLSSFTSSWIDDF